MGQFFLGVVVRAAFALLFEVADSFVSQSRFPDRGNLLRCLEPALCS